MNFCQHGNWRECTPIYTRPSIDMISSFYILHRKPILLKLLDEALKPRLLETYFVQETIFLFFPTYHCVLFSFRLHSQPTRVIFEKKKKLKGAQGKNKGVKLCSFQNFFISQITQVGLECKQKENNTQ